MGAQVVGVLGVRLVDATQPVLYADDAGMTRGDGCFEGCRVVDNTIDEFDAHLARMRRSAGALGIAFDEDAWRALIAEAVAAWPESGEAAMRWFLTRGRPGAAPTGLVTIAPMPADSAVQRRDGIRAITLQRGYAHDAFADAPWLLGGVKTLSYAVNMAAQREAERRGVDDAIFVTVDDHVLEAPTSSVVWTVDDAMYTTPTGESGILAGTTQQRLFANAAASGWTTSVTPVRVDDLHEADAIFLVSAVRGPVDVIELDGRAPGQRDVDLVRAVQKLAGF